MIDAPSFRPASLSRPQANRETLRAAHGTIRRPARYSAGVLVGEIMSAFSLYVLGFVVLLGGLVYGAVIIHVPQTWIIVGALVLIGLGIMSAVAHTKQRDTPAP
jgi:hypothetical protein